mgnify:CR=1 FL=1
MAKQSKNLEKVQDMLDGSYKTKIQVGTHNPKSVHEGRQIGDKWEDSDGAQWEQMDGYRSKVSKLPPRGIADSCPDCESFIIKAWDKDCFKHNSRCYYCQINYEAQYSRTVFTGKDKFKDFQGVDGGKKWVKLSKKKKKEFLDTALNEHEKYQFKRLDEYVKAFKKEEKIWKKETEESNSTVFDKSVANALANENIDTQNVKLKSKS